MIKDAEQLSEYFNLEIQSDYFGNGRSLSIEDWNIEFVDVNHILQSKLYSHLSSDSRQDAFTPHSHMITILHELQKNKK